MASGLFAGGGQDGRRLRCHACALLLTGRNSCRIAAAQALRGGGPVLANVYNKAEFFPMSSEILNVLSAAASAGEAPPAWMQFLPLVAMGVIFWFLILRPQMKRQKEQANKIAAIKRGDQVLTGGGFVGKVIKVDDNYVEVELAPSIKVKAVKSTIADVLGADGNPPAND